MKQLSVNSSYLASRTFRGLPTTFERNKTDEMFLSSLIGTQYIEKTLRRLYIVVALSITFFSFSNAVATAKSTSKEKTELASIQTLDSHYGPITLKTWGSSQPRALEPFTLTLELETPSQFSISANDLAGLYGDFEFELLEDKADAISDNQKLFTRSWQVYPTNTGVLTIPPIPLSLNANSQNEEKQIDVLTSPLVFEIEAVSENVSLDSLQPDYSPIRVFPLWQSLLVIALIAIAFVAWSRLKNRNTVETLENKFQAPEIPYEKAIRRLSELKSSRIYLENTAEFYLEITAILRRYLAERFAINAEEETTPEILAHGASHKLPAIDALSTDPNIDFVADYSHVSRVERSAIGIGVVLNDSQIRANLTTTLNSVDLIKFAKRETTFQDASQIFNLTQETIERADCLFKAELERRNRELEKEALEKASTLSNESVPQLAKED